jgi:hypothetical protein
MRSACRSASRCRPVVSVSSPSIPGAMTSNLQGRPVRVQAASARRSASGLRRPGSVPRVSTSPPTSTRACLTVRQRLGPRTGRCRRRPGRRGSCGRVCRSGRHASPALEPVECSLDDVAVAVQLGGQAWGPAAAAALVDAVGDPVAEPCHLTRKRRADVSRRGVPDPWFTRCNGRPSSAGHRPACQMA